MKSYLILFLMFLPAARLSGQLPGAIEMRISDDGLRFEIDLYREGKESQLLLSVDEMGNPKITGLGPGDFVYSTFIGPTYGKLVQFGDVVVEYYHDTRRAGKLARIGSIELEYFDPYIGDIRAGKLSRAGMLEFDYYLEIDGENKMGRLSGVDGVPVDYYYGGNLNGKVMRVGEARFRFFLDSPGDVRSGRISSVHGHQPGWVIQLRATK